MEPILNVVATAADISRQPIQAGYVETLDSIHLLSGAGNGNAVECA